MSINIVVLDGIYANPGDLSWEALNNLGQVTLHERSAPIEVIERSKEATVLVINKIKLDVSHFEALPNLKLVVISATGTDNVDLEAARKYNVSVKNVEGYSTESVTQHVFALLNACNSRVKQYDQSVRAGHWHDATGFSYSLHSLPELAGKTLGIYGFGRIGRRVAEVGTAMGMKIAVVSGHATAESFPFYRFVDLEELFQFSDVISLHAPLTATNAGIVNHTLLSRMKPSAILINTARGALVNETDLRDVLVNRKIAGAALDVLSQEPPQPNHPLLHLDSCLITPHMAWTAIEARKRLIEAVVNHISDFIPFFDNNKP